MQPGVTPGATFEFHAARCNGGGLPGINSPLTVIAKDTSGNGNDATLVGFGGLVIGNPDNNPTTTVTDLANKKRGSQFPVQLVAPITKLTAYLRNTGTGHAACHVKGLIYADSAGAPGALLATTNEVAIADNMATTAVDLTLASPYTPTSTSPLWLVVHGDASCTGLQLWYVSLPDGVSCLGADTYADGPSDPFGSNTPGVAYFAISATFAGAIGREWSGYEGDTTSKVPVYKAVNLAVNPSFETDSNSDGLADHASYYTAIAGTRAYTRPAGRVSGVCQRMVQTGGVGDSALSAGLVAQRTLPGTVNPGDVIAFSAWVKGSTTGCTIQMVPVIRAAGGTASGANMLGPTITLSGSWQRVYGEYSAGAYANYADLTLRTVGDFDNGDVLDLYVDDVTIEKRGWMAGAYFTDPVAASGGPHLTLDGSDDTVNLPAAVAPGLGDFSLDGWVYLPAHMLANHGMLLGCNFNGPGGYGIYVGDTATEPQTFYLQTFLCTSAAGDRLTTGNPPGVTANAWHHFASTFDRDGNMRAWLDGVAGSNVAISSKSTLNLTTAPNIGTYSGWFASFMLQSVRVYPFVLSDAQIAQNYAAGPFWLNHSARGPVNSLGRRMVA